MSEKKIPYKIYLEESEMPKEWYNVRADMKNKPAPLLNPGTLKPMTEEELDVVFCKELVKQEMCIRDRYRPRRGGCILYGREAIEKLLSQFYNPKCIHNRTE